MLIKLSQNESFSDVINALKAEQQTKFRVVSSLTPLIDNSGFLRVEGRLQLFDLDYAKKHTYFR